MNFGSVFNETVSKNTIQFEGPQCIIKWKNLVDACRKKIDKSGSAGIPISECVAQWRFFDSMLFVREYIVNRK